jgi:hypothetical protein
MLEILTTIRCVVKTDNTNPHRIKNVQPEKYPLSPAGEGT